MQIRIITKGIIFVCFLLMSCVSQQAIQDDKKWSPIYRFQLGANKGGIVENTDLTVLDNAGIDAFTGATRRGVHASGKVMQWCYPWFFNITLQVEQWRKAGFLCGWIPGHTGV